MNLEFGALSRRRGPKWALGSSPLLYVREVGDILGSLCPANTLPLSTTMSMSPGALSEGAGVVGKGQDSPLYRKIVPSC